MDNSHLLDTNQPESNDLGSNNISKGIVFTAFVGKAVLLHPLLVVGLLSGLMTHFGVYDFRRGPE